MVSNPFAIEMKASTRVASVLPATQPFGTPPPACLPAGPSVCSTLRRTHAAVGTPHLTHSENPIALLSTPPLLTDGNHRSTRCSSSLPSSIAAFLPSPLCILHRRGDDNKLSANAPFSSASLNPLVATCSCLRRISPKHPLIPPPPPPELPPLSTLIVTLPASQPDAIRRSTLARHNIFCLTMNASTTNNLYTYSKAEQPRLPHPAPS